MNEEKIVIEKEFNWEEFESEGTDAKTFKKRIRDSKTSTKTEKEREMYDLYFGEDISYEPKDLIEGIPYKCIVDYVTDGEAFASTNSGQTVYIDLDKELKAAKKLNVIGLDFEPGSEITIIARKVNGDYYGSAIDHYVDSLKIELFTQIKEEKTAYTARVESINKGGYIANISGIKCFLPGSLAAANKITDFESYIGKDIPVMVESYIATKDIFVISYKKYLEKIMEHKIQELDLTKKYVGSVTGTSSFGIFVEWSDIYTGLLYKTELSGLSEINSFNPGDEIEFYVKEVRDNNRLTLTFSEPLEKTIKLYEIEAQIEEGGYPRFDSIVKYKKKDGILVDIQELGSLALVQTNNLNNNDSDLRPGDEVSVIVYDVDVIAGKIFAMIAHE